MRESFRFGVVKADEVECKVMEPLQSQRSENDRK